MPRRKNNSPSTDRFQTKSALYEHVRHTLVLERLCTRFHLVAGQLRARHGNRPALHGQDQYDVQDLLRALLTLEYDDVRPREWTPGYASAPRTDFLLKLEQTVVAARMAESGWGAKELGEQLEVDVQKYAQHPNCKTLVCFVYDPDRRIANPRGIESDLGGDRDGLTVRVIIAPK